MYRICELVNICNYNGETSDCGALEGDREMEGGIIRNGSVIEERREERDGCRVKCLSALIPVLASHPTLHHMALSGEYISTTINVHYVCTSTAKRKISCLPSHKYIILHNLIHIPCFSSLFSCLYSSD